MPDTSPPSIRRAMNSEFAWRSVLAALVGLQVLALVICVAYVFWEVESPWLHAPFISFISVLGLLLWSVESISPRPRLAKFAIRCVLMTFLGWLAVIIVLLPFRKNIKSDERLKAEATGHFHSLVENGELPAPLAGSDLAVRMRHGTFLEYQDEHGNTRRYLARRSLEAVWVFQDFTTGKKVISRGEKGSGMDY